MWENSTITSKVSEKIEVFNFVFTKKKEYLCQKMNKTKETKKQ